MKRFYVMVMAVLLLFSCALCSGRCGGELTALAAARETEAGFLTAGDAEDGILIVDDAEDGILTAGDAEDGILTAGDAEDGILTADDAEDGFLTADDAEDGFLTAGETEADAETASGAAKTAACVLRDAARRFRADPGFECRRILHRARLWNDAWPWLIRVNQGTCTVTIYRGEDTAVKAFPCSPGIYGATPDGDYKVLDHLRWHELIGPSWGQWCSHIGNSLLFHSIPYEVSSDPYSMSTYGYNMLGQPASHGCIRLAAADAKYIYDYVPVGTKVEIFTGTAEDDPLGKPERPYVGEWTHTYDPTDPEIPENTQVRAKE